MQDKVSELTNICQEKIVEMESSSVEIKESLKKPFANAQSSLNNITSQLNQQIKNFENPSEKIILAIAKKVTQVESSVQVLYQEIDKSSKA